VHQKNITAKDYQLILTLNRAGQNVNKMITEVKKTIDFVKEDKLWYVDLPEFIEKGLGEKGNLLMVAGADKFLEMSSDDKPKVTVTISNKPFEGAREMINTSVGVDLQMLKDYNHPIVTHGGYYRIVDNNYDMWLCPTLLYVFENDKYPPFIFFKIEK
jgi:hypothetical protein